MFAVGQRFMSSSAQWLWLKASHEVAVKLSPGDHQAGRSASEMVLGHVAAKPVLAIGRLQFLPQSSGKSTYLTSYSRRNKLDK